MFCETVDVLRGCGERKSYCTRRNKTKGEEEDRARRDGDGKRRGRSTDVERVVEVRGEEKERAEHDLPIRSGP